jgi:hypothetical protein
MEGSQRRRRAGDAFIVVSTKGGSMHRRFRLLIAVAAAVALMGTAMPAGANHLDRPQTKNLRSLGHIEEPRSLFHGDPNVHTDMAFWGRYAFQGSWLGFNIRNIQSPHNPQPVSSTRCERPQGDMVIWENVLVRTADGLAPAPFNCDGQTVPAGFGGLHIFDVSNKKDPSLIGQIEVPCGSHTATGVPDLDNNRLLIYSSSSRDACPQIDIVEIPLDDPGNPSHVRTVPSGDPDDMDDHGRMCHDTGVILGDAMKAACAGHEGYTLWSLDPADGGSLEDPAFLYSRHIPGATIGHSAAFSFDGEVLIFGHEPGGGVQAQCQETTPDFNKQKFFFDVETGDLLGTWVLPRPQGPTENCTIHVYNVVPVADRNVMAGGHYQAGTWVVDFTDPANAHSIAWADPPSLGPGPFCTNTSPPGCQLGGAWSSYWYNGFIYESDITRGLAIYKASHHSLAGELKLSHLNPQTQEFSLP